MASRVGLRWGVPQGVQAPEPFDERLSHLGVLGGARLLLDGAGPAQGGGGRRTAGRRRHARGKHRPVQLHQRRMPWRAPQARALPPQPQHPCDGERTDDGCADPHEGDPVRGIEAPIAQQGHLFLPGVLQHPHVPAVVGGVCVGPQPAPDRRVEPLQGLWQLLGIADGWAGAINAVGGHRRGRVDARPATLWRPVFGPCVGIAVAHDVQAVHRVDLGALEARDHASGHAHRPEDHDEGGGVVLAKAGLAVQPEAVDGMGAWEAIAEASGGFRLGLASLALRVFRRQGVAEATLADVPEQHLHHRVRACVLQVGALAQLRGPGQGARVVAHGQGEVVATDLVGAWVAGVAGAHPGAGIDLGALGQGLLRMPAQAIAAQPRVRTVRCDPGGQGAIQQGHGAQPVGLERELVVDLPAGGLWGAALVCGGGRRGWPRQLPQGGAAGPVATIEAVQNRASEVHLVMQGRRALEAHAHGHAVVQGEFGHLAELDAVGQTCSRAAVGRGAPQGADARKEQVQRQHDGHAHRHAARRGANGRGNGGASLLSLCQHQRAQQAEGGQQHQRGQADGLRMQELRQHQEKAQRCHHEGVAPCPQLQRLERRQQGHQGDAGLSAEERLVRGQGQPGGCGQRNQQHPARRQRGIVPGQPGSPGDGHGRAHAAPQGQAPDVRQDANGDHGQQPQGVAALAAESGAGLAVHRVRSVAGAAPPGQVASVSRQ